MAKQRGPVASSFTGRVGNVVGAKLKGGEYVTRSYQPDVKNPNTVRQRNSRARMAKSSQLASELSAAINIGYAMAAGSTRMFPRNMFVAKAIKEKVGGVISYDNGDLVVQMQNAELSQKVGLNVIPSVVSAAAGTGRNIVLTLNEPSVEDSLPEGTLGLVVAVRRMSDGAVAVFTVEASQSVTVELPANMAQGEFDVLAFYKWIPYSKNDIATTNLPWRFPSETGATVYCGQVVI